MPAPRFCSSSVTLKFAWLADESAFKTACFAAITMLASLPALRMKLRSVVTPSVVRRGKIAMYKVGNAGRAQLAFWHGKCGVMPLEAGDWKSHALPGSNVAMLAKYLQLSTCSMAYAYS